jgi:rhodanese-related sulfurtransferase
MEFLKNYWPILGLSLWFGYKWWNSRKILLMLPELKKRGAQLVDVRSLAEFNAGHAEGTINIPLQELQARQHELSQITPVVLACASGTRSGMAKMVLRKSGFKEVYNIGSWTKF